MENRECKNKKCRRVLPEGYKHKYCENCRNEKVKRVRDTGKAALSVGVMIGGPIIVAVIKGKNKLDKKN